MAEERQEQTGEELWSQPVVSTRRRVILGLLSPGTSWMMRGSVAAGIGINTVLTLSVVLTGIVCVRLGLFPVPAYGAMIVLCLALWVRGIWLAVSTGKIWAVSNLSRFQVLGSVAFLTFWLPLVFSAYICGHFVFERALMGNETMMPGIIPGDVILVDKLSPRYAAPTYGDLVLVDEVVEESDGSSRLRSFFGRVIACAGDDIQIIGIRPSVNHKKLMHYYRNTLVDDEPKTGPLTEIVYELPVGVQVPESIENEPDRWYAVISPEHQLFSQTNHIQIEPNYFYVLEDNRNTTADNASKGYGAVIHRGQIQGIPRYILYNTESGSPLERFGIRLR